MDGDYYSLLNTVAQNKDNKMEFIKILKLNDFEAIKEDALLYLVIRHLIIHNASVADEAYKKRSIANKVELLDDDKISFTYKLFDNAVNAINALCQILDSELLKKMLVKPRTGSTK